MIRIWVDADACPVKDEIERIAGRRGARIVHVCALEGFKRAAAEVVCVEGGPDAADEWILAHCAAGDLVITQDIPLASEAVKRGARVLEFRGRELHPGNMPERLAARNIATELRDRGYETKGPPPFTPRDRREFCGSLARVLDVTLAKLSKGEPENPNA